MSYNTLFICVGGTGTQVGTAIGTLYPLLKSSRIAKSDDEYSMFIMDKDTAGDNYSYCVGVLEKYKNIINFKETKEGEEKAPSFLPFEVLPPYELHATLYKDLQEKREKSGGVPTDDCTVMKLIGDNKAVVELANMCWEKEKRTESLTDGNNRDPSRGSIDSHVSLKYLKQTSLFQKIKTLIGTSTSKGDIRIVIIAGITGGMGASLIVPLVEELKEFSNDDNLKKIAEIRVDIVAIGPYFNIPSNSDGKEVDNIGTSSDSYHRAKDQIKELTELVETYKDVNWNVYYVDVPDDLDDICGTFNKNRANKRQTHLVELMAALAIFDLREYKNGGHHQTLLEHKKEKIDWDELAQGDKLKPYARTLMKLIVIVATELFPRFSQKDEDLKKDVFIKMYFRKVEENILLIEEIASKIKEWLINAIPYFNFWNDIRTHFKFGKNHNISIEFFDKADMDSLETIFASVTNKADVSWEKKPLNKIPLCKKTWMNYVVAIKPSSKINEILDKKQTRAEAMFSLILKDIYEVLKKEN